MNYSLEHDFLKIAHRGASAYEPENTLRSFKVAIDMKADMIEFDVRMSKDGHLVVIHDNTVDRTTNGRGYVKELTLEELENLDAGRGEKIPTLKEVIELGVGKTKFAIEIKEGGTEKKAISLIKEYNLLEDVFIISKNRDLLKNVKILEGDIRTCLIMVLSCTSIDSGRESLADAIAPFHFFITKRLVKKAQRSGLFLFTWIVDSKKRAQWMKDIGINGIVTNKPDII
ncbi:MAG: glycerophosphodiester phosphodiesterase [Deltaproteobacteria bacterium]|nr:glycerophosphodiester phosphodiesterase [Deltaproteobacteria bacterium]